MKRLTMFILLCAIHAPGIAQQAPANPDAGGNLPAVPDATQQVLPVKPEPQNAVTAPTPVRLDDQAGRISDPTQMTGSFSQALDRVHGKAGAVGGQAAGAGLPKFELTARICRHDSKAVMLNVAGKNHMIKEGGKFSFLENNVLHEIQIGRIEKDHVEITLLPAGRKMILE